jgi:hypothetical protein
LHLLEADTRAVKMKKKFVLLFYYFVCHVLHILNWNKSHSIKYKNEKIYNNIYNIYTLSFDNSCAYLKFGSAYYDTMIVDNLNLTLKN